jgi:hypothetical protein
MFNLLKKLDPWVRGLTFVRNQNEKHRVIEDIELLPGREVLNLNVSSA